MFKTFLPHYLLVMIMGFSFPAHAKLLDKVVAIVDDSPILESDIKSLVSQLKKNQDLSNLYGMQGKALTRHNVLNKLIEEKIIRVSLKNINAGVENGEVTAQIKGIADQNNVNIAELQASLERDGVPFSAYKRSIRTQLERRRIFDREVRKTAASLSDLELRNEFMKNAPKEYFLGMLIDKENSSNKKLFLEISKKINNGSLPTEELKEHPSYQSLGWIEPQSMGPSFRNALKNTKDGHSTQPITTEKRVHLLIVHTSRQGSAEQFESQKEKIRGQLMASDYESRFNNWLEKKKKDLQVVINK